MISYTNIIDTFKNIATNHYLLNAVQEPGQIYPKFTSTISIKNYRPSTKNLKIGSSENFH